jgi:hypothetical protein
MRIWHLDVFKMIFGRIGCHLTRQPKPGGFESVLLARECKPPLVSTQGNNLGAEGELWKNQDWFQATCSASSLTKTACAQNHFENVKVPYPVGDGKKLGLLFKRF